MVSKYRITIRDRDLPTWEEGRREAERQYVPFSRFLVKILREHLKGLQEDDKEVTNGRS